MNEKCLVLRVGEHLVEKDFAGISLLVENVPLAKAGVDEQAERQGQVRVLRKILDHLRTAVFLKNEIVLSQIANDLSLLVTNGDRKRDHFYVDRHGGNALAVCSRSRCILTMRIPTKHRQSGQENADEREPQPEISSHGQPSCHCGCASDGIPISFPISI